MMDEAYLYESLGSLKATVDALGDKVDVLAAETRKIIENQEKRLKAVEDENLAMHAKIRTLRWVGAGLIAIVGAGVKFLH